MPPETSTILPLIHALRSLATNTTTSAISDGAPVDQATLEENNDKAVLDRHLRDVIVQIESSGSIELAAIGVKHDVRKYYANSAQIDKVDALGEALIRMVDELLTR